VRRSAETRSEWLRQKGREIEGYRRESRRASAAGLPAPVSEPPLRPTKLGGISPNRDRSAPGRRTARAAVPRSLERLGRLSSTFQIRDLPTHRSGVDSGDCPATSPPARARSHREPARALPARRGRRRPARRVDTALGELDVGAAPTVVAVHLANHADRILPPFALSAPAGVLAASSTGGPGARANVEQICRCWRDSGSGRANLSAPGAPARHPEHLSRSSARVTRTVQCDHAPAWAASRA
jgi:hypothetical protein